MTVQRTGGSTGAVAAPSADSALSRASSVPSASPTIKAASSLDSHTTGPGLPVPAPATLEEQAPIEDSADADPAHRLYLPVAPELRRASRLTSYSTRSHFPGWTYFVTCRVLFPFAVQATLAKQIPSASARQRRERTSLGKQQFHPEKSTALDVAPSCRKPERARQAPLLYTRV